MKTRLTWGLLSKYRNELYGFAIIFVMILHALITFTSLDLGWLYSNLGWRGSFAVDGFLILSGICLYYSMRNREKVVSGKKKLVFGFYRKRFSRLFLIYLLFCIPVMIIRSIVLKNSAAEFFSRELNPLNVDNTYWYIIFISLAYLIYPYIYFLLKKPKGNKVLICLIIAFIIGSVLLSVASDGFSKCNKFIGRIPAFLIGTLLGPLVFDNKKISNKTLVLSLLSLLFFGPIITFLSKLPFFGYWQIEYIKRILGTFCSLGTGFVIVIILDYLKPTRFLSGMQKIGEYSLEIYVAHVAMYLTIPLALNIPNRLLYAVPSITIMYAAAIVLAVFLKKLISFILKDRRNNGSKN